VRASWTSRYLAAAGCGHVQWTWRLREHGSGDRPRGPRHVSDPSVRRALDEHMEERFRRAAMPIRPATWSTTPNAHAEASACPPAQPPRVRCHDLIAELLRAVAVGTPATGVRPRFPSGLAMHQKSFLMPVTIKTALLGDRTYGNEMSDCASEQSRAMSDSTPGVGVGRPRNGYGMANRGNQVRFVSRVVIE